MAARELKEQGIPFEIHEANNRPGGKVQSIEVDGAHADLGAHWLHNDDDNPLTAIARKAGLTLQKDTASNRLAYVDGTRHGSEFRTNLSQYFDASKVAQVRDGNIADIPYHKLTNSPEGEDLIKRLTPTWSGVDANDASPSATALLKSANEPGGYVVKEGFQAVIDALVKEVGEENIHYNSRVKKVDNSQETSRVEFADGSTAIGKKTLFTGSLGVLRSGQIEFNPPPREVAAHLKGMQTAYMAKIVMKVDPQFFAQHPNLHDLHVNILDGDKTSLLNVASAGQPFVTLMVGGKEARRLETLPASELNRYFFDHIKDVAELNGLQAHLKGAPIRTGWSKAATSMGCYSSTNVGAERSGALSMGNLHFAGEAIETEYAATTNGAARSGQRAARNIAKELEKDVTEQLAPQVPPCPPQSFVNMVEVNRNQPAPNGKPWHFTR